MRVSGFRRLAFLIVLPAVAIPARADLFYVKTQSVSSHDDQVSISYNSATGATLAISDAHGATLTHSGSPNVTGLDSSFDETTLNELTPNGPVSASSFASANLAAGALKETAAGSATVPNGAFGAASASAELFDTLTFTIAGAGQSTVTYITVNYNLDGTVSKSFYYSYGAELDSLTFGSALTSFYNNTAQTWSSANFISSSPMNGVFQGTYALVGPNPVVSVDLKLALSCQDGCVQDYSNTSLISLTLPSDVSFKSASGVFLTPKSTVPEASGWVTILIGGIGMGTGIALRRIKCSAVRYA